jgi:hypothetical protein
LLRRRRRRVCLFGLWLTSLDLPPPHARDEGHRVRDGVGAVVRDPAVWLAGLAGLLLGPLDEPRLAIFIARLQDVGLSAAGATAIGAASVLGAFAGYASSGGGRRRRSATAWRSRSGRRRWRS